MTKLKLSNHKLMIEVGRHKNIDKENRLCPTCSAIETEINFLAECPLYSDLRSSLRNPLMINEKYTDDEKLTTLFGARECFVIRDALHIS